MASAWVLSAGGMPPAATSGVRVGVFATLAACEREVLKIAGDQKIVRRLCSPDRVQWVIKDHATAGAEGLAALASAVLVEATWQ